MRFDNKMKIWTTSWMTELTRGTRRPGALVRESPVGLGVIRRAGFAGDGAVSCRAGHDNWCVPDRLALQPHPKRLPGQDVPLVAKKADVVGVIEDIEFATY